MRTWLLADLTVATLLGISSALGQPPDTAAIAQYAPCTGEFDGNFSLSQRLGVCNAAIESKAFQGKDLAAFHVHRWAVLNAKKEPALAQADLETALAIWPGVADEVTGFAESYIADKDYALAKTALDGAEKAQPGNWRVHHYRAELYLRQGAFDLAAQESRKALVAQPDNAIVLRQESTVRAVNGDIDGAIAVLDKLVTQHPQSEIYYNERCYLRGVAGRELDKALADCNASLKIKQNNPNVLDSRGLVYLRMGQFAQAIADYTAAITLDDHPSPTSFYGRGVAEQKTANSMGAEADISAAETLSPGIDKTFDTLAILAE